MTATTPKRPAERAARWACLVLASMLAVAPIEPARAGLLDDLQRKAQDVLHSNAPARQAVPAPSVPTPPLPGLLVTRDPAALNRLFERGEISGADLVIELLAIQKLMAQQRSDAATAHLLGVVGEPASGSGFSLDPRQMMIDLALKRTDAVIREHTMAIGLHALDDHLRLLIDDPAGLAREVVRLPKPAGLTAQQLQRAAIIAAVAVATRVTARILKQAQQDFAGVEDDYARLIDRREKAASLLYGALAAASGSDPGLQDLFSDADRAYLRNTVSGMSLAEFSNDLGAQNLALRYLARQDPEAFAAYGAQRDGLLARTRGYLRLTGGVAAFGGLLAIFTHEMALVIKQPQGAEVIAVLPFAFDFVRQLPDLLSVAYAAGVQGVKLPFKSRRHFRVEQAGRTDEVNGAGDVFQSIAKTDAADEMRQALFRNGSLGLIYKLYFCDRVEAGRLLDTAAPPGDRSAFARTYLHSDDETASFANLFDRRQESPRLESLGDDLLRADQRPRTQIDVPTFHDMQNAVSAGYSAWGDEQLMRLIFANREGAAAQATLELGQTRIRPIPSATSVFVYESLVDHCKTLVEPAPLAHR